MRMSNPKLGNTYIEHFNLWKIIVRFTFVGKKWIREFILDIKFPFKCGIFENTTNKSPFLPILLTN